MKSVQSEGALARLHASRTAEKVARDAKVSRLQAAYVAMTRDERIFRDIQELVSVSARHHQAVAEGKVVGRLAEGRTVMVTGQSGAGKTRSLERNFEKFPEFANYRTDAGSCPLISVQVPSPFTLRQFAQDLAAAAGFRTDLVLRENVAWSNARSLIRERISFIHIDEAHNLLESNNPVEITKARSTLRNLLTCHDWPVCLILSGLPHMEVLAQDFQTFRRRSVIRFHSINIERDRALIRAAYNNFCDLAGVNQAGVLDSPETVERLVYASAHQFGVCFELMHDAITNALDLRRTSVSLDDFATAYFRRDGDASSNIMTMTEGWRGAKTWPATPEILGISPGTWKATQS